MKLLFGNLKKVYKLTKEYRRYAILYLIFIPILSLISIVVPLFTAKLLLYANDTLYDQLFNAALIILALELTRNVANYYSWYSIMVYFRESTRILKMRALNALFGIKNKSLDEVSSGIIIERVNSDCNKISDGIPNIIDALLDITTNLGVVLTIFVLSKIYFFYLLIGSVALFLINRHRIKAWYEYDKTRRTLSEKVTSFIAELVRGVRDIKVLDANESFLNNAENRIREFNQVSYEGRRSLRRYGFVAGTVHDLFDYTYVVLGIVLLRNNLVTVTSFVTIFLYKDRIYRMFDVYTRLQEDLQNFELSSNRVFELIDGDKYEREEFGTSEIKNINGEFEFKNVNFAYKKNIPVLKDMSFKVEAHTTVGFVGKSGAGKTTIFNLLAKLYEPNRGTILIDGIDIRELSSHSIRGNMTIINQNPYIFNMSIYDNLKLVNPKATKKEIKEACRVACLDEFIESLPDKYKTVVGEGGISLSGGQRQRLAIARALIQHTEIILFDEATSALDNQTQKSIQDAIDNMKGDYTIMIIAHRFSTIINCDKIFYMEDGKVKMSGTHSYLMKNCLEYKELYELEKENSI